MMDDIDMQELARWQSSPEGVIYRSIYDLENLIDELTAASKHREGVQMLRARYRELVLVKRKIDDLEMSLRPMFAMVAE